MEEVATGAVGGAMEAAGIIGNTAVKAVRDILVGVVEGVEEAPSTTLPKPKARSTQAADFDEG